MIWNLLAWLYEHFILRDAVAQIENIEPPANEAEEEEEDTNED